MAPEEKPYRVYRGGRVKGKVPGPARPQRPPRRAPTDADGGRYRGPGAARPPRTANWRRRIAIGVLVLVVLLLVWGVSSYLAFRSGVSDANARLDPNARLALNADGGGLLISHPTTILLLGTDHAQIGGREGDRHSDSIMLIRTDPKHHRIAYLSIPRDLYVEVPGQGQMKINGAFQVGGAALAMKTIRAYSGLDVNHVVLVDFADFKDLIDAIGGVDVDVPKPILSNRFDCPYATSARCQQWRGWRFRKGRQHMDGHRALIYSRIRENQLDPSENDLTRTDRQQAVVEAIQSRLVSPGTLLKMPFVGGDLVKPVATDLSTGQFLQLGWAKFRAGRTLHCHLGGTFGSTAAGSVIEPAEENRNVIAMFLGLSAAQPSPPGAPNLPGCTVG